MLNPRCAEIAEQLSNMLIDQRSNALDLADQPTLNQQISLQHSQHRTIFVEDFEFLLLLNANALLSETVCQGIFVNLLSMAIAQILMNLKTCFPDYIAKREDVTVVRIGFHYYLFLSFVPYVPFCGKTRWPSGSSTKWPSSYIFLPRRKVFCTTPVSTSPSYGVILWRCCSAPAATVNCCSGFQTTRSASFPTAIVPFRVRNETCRAGLAQSHFVRSSTVNPRRRASVQMIGSLSCSDAMPPQAFIKSPLSRNFISPGQGEWSDTIKSIVPSARPCHSPSRFSRSRIGGQHLNSVAPTGTSSAAK